MYYQRVGGNLDEQLREGARYVGMSTVLVSRYTLYGKLRKGASHLSSSFVVAAIESAGHIYFWMYAAFHVQACAPVAACT